ARRRCALYHAIAVDKFHAFKVVPGPKAPLPYYTKASLVTPQTQTRCGYTATNDRPARQARAAEQRPIPRGPPRSPHNRVTRSGYRVTRVPRSQRERPGRTPRGRPGN